MQPTLPSCHSSCNSRFAAIQAVLALGSVSFLCMQWIRPTDRHTEGKFRLVARSDVVNLRPLFASNFSTVKYSSSDDSTWTLFDSIFYLSAHYDYRDGTVNILLHAKQHPPTVLPEFLLGIREQSEAVKVDEFSMHGVSGYQYSKKKVKSSYSSRGNSVSEKASRTFYYVKLYVPLTYRNNLMTVTLRRITEPVPLQMKILHPNWDNSIKKNSKVNIGICMAPLFNANVVTPSKIIQFIEIHRILGVNKFIFHLYNASSEVVKLLKLYQSDGVVDILPWLLYKEPDGKGPTLHYHGQTTAYHRCMYKYLTTIKYMGVADIDEILTLRSQNFTSLADIVKMGNEETGMWTFLHKAFVLEATDNPKYPDARTLGITALLKTKKSVRVFPYAQRSKYIVKLDRVSAMTVHTASLKKGYYKYILKPSEGVLNHYRGRMRSFRFKEDNDEYMFQYAEQLIGNVRNMLKRLSYVG